MMSGVVLQERKSIYEHTYGDAYGFKAVVRMNARDAMVFGVIKALPDGEQNAAKSTEEFLDIFKKKYGAKACLSISPKLLEKLPKDFLKSSGGIGRFIGKKELAEAMERIKHKPHVAAWLKRLEHGFSFLTKEDLKTRARDLAEFKIKYSSFASAEKIKAGQYSEIAELAKLNNPFAEHYAIVNENNEIIACLMEMVFDDKTYDADFVVHPKYRSKDIHPDQLSSEQRHYEHGLAQAMAVLAYEDMLKKHPEVEGSWLIAGGYGKLGVGAYLYDVIFPTKVLDGNSELQNAAGLFLMFGPRGEEFLLAANRKLTADPELKFELVNDNENHAVQEALAWLKLSTEQDLAAKQVPSQLPVAPTQEKQVISPISMYAQPKLPENSEIANANQLKQRTSPSPTRHNS